jgi:hypothetical protein
LTAYPAGALLLEPATAIKALIGVAHSRGDTARWEGKLLDMANKNDIKALVRRVEALATDGPSHLLVNPAGITQVKTASRKYSSHTVKMICADEMLQLVLEEYKEQVIKCAADSAVHTTGYECINWYSMYLLLVYMNAQPPSWRYDHDHPTATITTTITTTTTTHTLHYTLYTMHYALYTVPHTIHYTLYTIH